MHDEASVPRAHIITNLLSDLSQELGVKIMTWPLHSQISIRLRIHEPS
jgi:hypothetical protein